MPEIAQPGQTHESTPHDQTSRLTDDAHAQSNVYITGAETNMRTPVTDDASQIISDMEQENLPHVMHENNGDTQSHQCFSTAANVVKSQQVKSGGYYKCQQNSTKQKRSKILPPSPQRDQQINDDDEPFDNILKFNIKNDNFIPAEIKDFENFNWKMTDDLQLHVPIWGKMIKIHTLWTQVTITHPAWGNADIIVWHLSCKISWTMKFILF